MFSYCLPHLVAILKINLAFIGPCIANIFAEYNQQDVTFHNLFIYVRRSTCFRRFSVHHQELKTVHTASDICQTVTSNGLTNT